MDNNNMLMMITKYKIKCKQKKIMRLNYNYSIFKHNKC